MATIARALFTLPVKSPSVLNLAANSEKMIIRQERPSSTQKNGMREGTKDIINKGWTWPGKISQRGTLAGVQGSQTFIYKSCTRVSVLTWIDGYTSHIYNNGVYFGWWMGL
jgi:hypothetical protein